MAINLVRKPSEIPNINNYDDYRMFRYATGGYNGVIEKYGNECDYEINGNTFKIKSGEIVIDGTQSKIDATGVTVVTDAVTGTEYYTVYCEVNLSLIDNQRSEIKVVKSTVTYPEIDKGDDLTTNQTGVARLELYRFIVTNSEILEMQKTFKIIPFGICNYASPDKTKGTIEERLTNLGFKSGNIVDPENDVVVGEVVRQGNYVIIKNFSSPYVQSRPNTSPIGILPFDFIPNETKKCKYANVIGFLSGMPTQGALPININNDGNLYIADFNPNLNFITVDFSNFGFSIE